MTKARHYSGTSFEAGVDFGIRKLQHIALDERQPIVLAYFLRQSVGSAYNCSNTLPSI